MAKKLPVVTPQTETLQRCLLDSYTLTGCEHNSQETLIVPKIPIVSTTEMKNYVCFYPNIRVIPDVNRTGYWSIVQSEPETKDIIPLNGMSGEFYQEGVDGIYSKENDGNVHKIFDIKIKIVRVTEIWSNEGLKSKNYICKILSEVWHGQCREITIASEKYKELFKTIHKKFPEIFLQDTSSELVQEYLTDVFRRDIDNAELVVKAEKIGWLNVYGNLRYRLGVDDFYKDYVIPDINAYDRALIFKKGTSFLNIGKANETISVLWITAHIAFGNYWFNECGKRFTSVVYLRGATNLLKTSVVKIISNIFDTNRDNATIRMTSTSAGIRYTLSMLPDTLICVDDFSNTELSGSKKALENAEDVIRAVGDGVFPVKMNVKDFSQGIRESVRATVILTGEEALPLGTSSQYRIVTLPVEEGTFNGEALRYFQNHPEIMAQYFSLYIRYLTERGKLISNAVPEKIAKYHNEFEQRLSVRRFAETAAFFKLQVDIMYDFAIWCNICEEDARNLCTMLNENISLTMTRNQDSGAKIKPTLLFLIALWQSFNASANAALAESENLYVNSESKFLGFHDEANNFIWLKPNDAYNVAVTYYRKQGKNFLVQFETLKQALLREGYSDGILPENGKGGQYVKRAKKGARKYMLVLKVNEVEKALESLKEEM